MFLRGLFRRGYLRDGTQYAKGAFLILMSNADDPRSKQYRGLVRFVSLQQSGHFMVGRLSIGCKGGAHIHLSGAYGADGLIREVPAEIYKLGTDLPANLYDAWNKGEGHNSAGNEAVLMDAWARTLKWPASTYAKHPGYRE